MAERRGGVWKNTFLNMVEIVSSTSRYEVDEIVDQTKFAVNIFPRMDEYSPHQYVFGKEHGIPGNLELRDEKLGGNINSTSWRNNVSQETGDSEQSTEAVHSGT